MNKILLVTQREYLTRVKKKSFLLMTILGPLLFALFYGGIIFVSIQETEGDKTKTVHIVNGENLFSDLQKNGNIEFVNTKKSPEELISTYSNSKTDAILIIEPEFSESNTKAVSLLSSSNLSITEQDKIETALENRIYDLKLKAKGLSSSSIDSLKTNINLSVKTIDNEGSLKDSSVEINSALGLTFSVLIYMFIFMYGVQVMRGVLEEKTNRIVEVVISTIKPFDLMMGKIFGIALVSLTQFIIWIILSTSLFSIIGIFAAGSIPVAEVSNMAGSMPEGADLSKTAKILNLIGEINFGGLISVFIFYFVTGYLFYSALFAAIAAAVDNETDTQQFMFPITIPLIFGLIISYSLVIKDPNGSLAFWFSMFPPTAPIVMMVRWPFLENQWELWLSMALMIAGFIITTKFAAKIYRTGILLYGKKVNYKELAKWLLYKNG